MAWVRCIGGSGGGVTSAWFGTQDEYDELSDYDSSVVYNIMEGVTVVRIYSDNNIIWEHPGLVFRLLNLDTLHDMSMMDSFMTEHYAFDSSRTLLDHTEYSKLKIDINIKQMSYVLENDPTPLQGTEADYYARYEADYTVADSISYSSTTANPTPLNPLIQAYPAIGSASYSTLLYGSFTHLPLLSVYQSEPSGVVYCFMKARLPNESSSSNGYVMGRIDKILKHMENKTVSVIFSKNTPELYTVLVDGEMAFTNTRTNPKYFEGGRSLYPVDKPLHRLSIGNVNDRAGLNTIEGRPNMFGWANSEKDATCPYRYMQQSAISYNLLSMRYIE